MSFQEVFSGQIITNATIKPDSPQFSKTNPLKSNVFVNGIELILTPEFSKKGAILVLIDGHTKFNSLGTNPFSGYSKFPIPLKQEILRDVKTEIFAWNKVDSNSIECNLNLSMSKDPQPFSSQAVPMDLQVYNDFVSENEILFPQSTRVNNTETKLIDMKGNKKLRVFFSAAVYVPNLSVIIGDSTIIDGNLATGYVTLGGTTTMAVVDFGTSISRNIEAFCHVQSGGSSNYNYILEGSNDNVSYTPIHTINKSGVFNVDITLISTSQSYRYYRVRMDRISGFDTPTDTVYEIYDTSLFGGTSSLSFEGLDPSSNQWIEIIAASEFGTIANGSALSKEVGDVNTISVSGKTYALPSTQTSFRAKLVTIGTLQTSISITRMS